jgi:hypothetical protein
VWYVRQRNAHFKADVLGVPVRVTADDMADERGVVEAVRRFSLTTRYKQLIERGSLAADAEIVSLLASAPMSGSKLLLEGAIAELEAKETVDHAAALAVATRFGHPLLGEGVARLEKINPDLATSATSIKSIASSGVVPELDRLAVLVKEDAEVESLASKVAEMAKAGEIEELATFVSAELETRGGVVP